MNLVHRNVLEFPNPTDHCQTCRSFSSQGPGRKPLKNPSKRRKPGSLVFFGFDRPLGTRWAPVGHPCSIRSHHDFVLLGPNPGAFRRRAGSGARGGLHRFPTAARCVLGGVASGLRGDAGPQEGEVILWVLGRGGTKRRNRLPIVLPARHQCQTCGHSIDVLQSFAGCANKASECCTTCDQASSASIQACDTPRSRPVPEPHFGPATHVALRKPRWAAVRRLQTSRQVGTLRSERKAIGVTRASVLCRTPGPFICWYESTQLVKRMFTSGENQHHLAAVPLLRSPISRPLGIWRDPSQ